MALQRGMFNRLPIKYKLLVMPAFAAIGLLVVLATSLYLGDTEEKQMRLVENDYYPSVQLSADVEKRFAALQRGLQDAVAARNTAALDEIDAMRIQLIARLDGGKRITVLDAKQVDALKASIDDYYALARDTSVRMIGGETGEGIFKSLQTMQARYTAVADTVKKNTERDQQAIGLAPGGILAVAANRRRELLIAQAERLAVGHGVHPPLVLGSGASAGAVDDDLALARLEPAVGEDPGAKRAHPRREL